MMLMKSRLLLLLFLPFAGLAQDRALQPKRPFIRATGEATVAAKPDQVKVDIGVTSQAETAQAAASENARHTDAVMQQIRQAFGAVAQLKTLGYSVSPQYRYPKPGGPPSIAGYTVSNTIEVKLDDISRAGKLIDLATQSGANAIHSLQFGLKDETALQAQALREASANARAKAEAMAGGLSLKIAGVISAEEGGTNIVRPMAPMVMARKVEAAPTPVAADNIEVHASVTLTVEVSP